MQTGEDRRALALAGAGVEVRQNGDGEQPRFRGHAAVFDSRTPIGDPFTWGFYEEIAPGCFTDTLAHDDQRFLLDHNPFYVVSRASAGSLCLAQDGRGLAVDSALDTRLSYVNDLVINIENRNVSGMSFGFFATADEWSTIRERDASGQMRDVELRRVRAAKVPEVSAVTFPAYEASEAGLRADDPVRAVGLALRERPDAAAQFEARARHEPELARYFERERVSVRGDTRPADEVLHRAGDGLGGTRAQEQRKAVASHSTGTDDAAWDGPAQEKKLTDLDESTGRKMYAWQDPDGDPTTKSAWKFPHHFVDGNGNPGDASTKACENGISILNGGRGGSDIPDADRQGVYNHLAKHLRDADKDPAPLEDCARAVGPLSELRTRGRQPAYGAPSSADWYSIQRRDDGAEPEEPSSTEVFLYDVIGGFWGPSTEDFVRDLAAIDTDTITVRINSPGGSVFDGLAILNALRGHPAHITTLIEGLAASAASFIAMAGDTVVIWRNAEMMIHDPLTIAIGNAADFRDLAERLDRIGDNIASVYADRAGGDVADWRDAMDAETWYSAEEAVEAGLADEVRAPADREDGSSDDSEDRSFDLSGFRYAGRATAPGPARPGATRRLSIPTDAEMQARRGKSLAARFGG